MKTIKFIFAFALIALATSAFSQRSFSAQNAEEELIKVKYTLENSRKAHKVGDFLDKFKTTGRKSKEEAVVYMSFVMDQPEVVYEEVYHMESWMMHPFGSNVVEMDLHMESWMAQPFHCNYSETDPAVESWMTTPFNTSESIEVESWMTAAWL